MSIIQQHTSASLSDAWRTINIDALQEDSSVNFDTSTLHPPLPEIGEAEVRALAGQVRQLLRGGDAEGALRGCLEMPVYNGSDLAKDAHLQTVVEVLQSIKASEMTPMLQRIYQGDGGSELLDVLMKYLCVVSPPFGSADFYNMSPFDTREPTWSGELTLASFPSSRYKGMASTSGGSAPRTPTRVTPQATGFSQVGGRPGAANESAGAGMSVLLSWHEKVVDVAGLGCIGRTMTDWRRV